MENLACFTWRARSPLAGPVWASQLASELLVEYAGHSGQAGCLTMITCLAALGAQPAWPRRISWLQGCCGRVATSGIAATSYSTTSLK